MPRPAIYNHKEIWPAVYIAAAFISIWSLYIGFHFKLYMAAMILFAPFGRYIYGKIYCYEVIFLSLLSYLFIHSSIYSSNPTDSTRMLLGMLLITIYYIISKSLFTRWKLLIDRGLYISSWSIVIASFILYFAGIYQNHIVGETPRLSWGVMYERDLYRMTGIWIDPNFAGLGMLLIIFYSIFWGKVRPILGLVAGLAFVLCLSRGAILAAIIGISTLLMIRLVSGRLNMQQMLLVVAGVLLMCVSVFAALQVPELREVLTHRFSNLSSGSGRVDLWAAGLEAWALNPFVGVGLYNFGSAIGEPGRFAHNTPLEMLIEGGVAAFILYGLFAIAVMWRAAHTKHSTFFTATFAAVFGMSLSLSLLIYEGIFLLLAIMAADSIKAEIFDGGKTPN